MIGKEKEMNEPWKIVNVGGVYGIECPYCSHKMSLKDFIFGDKDIREECPFCKKAVSIDSLDYNKVLDLVERTPE